MSRTLFELRWVWLTLEAIVSQLCCSLKLSLIWLLIVNSWLLAVFRSIGMLCIEYCSIGTKSSTISSFRIILCQTRLSADGRMASIRSEWRRGRGLAIYCWKKANEENENSLTASMILNLKVYIVFSDFRSKGITSSGFGLNANSQ